MKKRILIVEDEKIIAEDIKHSLLSFGYDVIGIISSGEDAVIEAQKERPDIVLMDIMLNGEMTGLEAARLIYNNYNIPALFLTAYATEEILQEAALSSPFGYLIKPFEERELKVNLDMALYKHSMEKNLRNSRNFLLTLIDTVPTFISVKDKDHKYVIANKAIIDEYQTTPTAIIGKTDFDFPDAVILNKNNIIQNQLAEQEVLKKQTLRMLPEMSVKNKDGELKWYQETKVPIITPDNKNAVLTVTVDITERKKNAEILQEEYKKLRILMEETVDGLVSALEKRDPYTAGHQKRVASLANEIALEMNLSKDQTNGLRIAAIVHDIGKIYVPSEILSKPGKLSSAEMNLIRTHPHAGYEILCNIHFPWPVAEIVLQHHERLDGSGYPNNLKDDEIILEARILSVADVVEAISSYRPYRPALGMENALAEITQNSGKLYDPKIVEACLKVINEKNFVF